MSTISTLQMSTISAGERPAAAHLLRSWVRLPPGAWIFVCCECRVLSGRGLCDELIARPEEYYRLWCVVVCDLETSRICTPYIYDITSLRVNDLSLILLTWRKWWANNARNFQIGFNSEFKGLKKWLFMPCSVPPWYRLIQRQCPVLGSSDYVASIKTIIAESPVHLSYPNVNLIGVSIQ
jgi:hypothetical protein